MHSILKIDLNYKFTVILINYDQLLFSKLTLLIPKFNNKNYSYLSFVVVLGISIFCIYGQTIRFDYALDDHLITDNLPDIESGLEGFKTIFTSRYNISEYRPITIASFHIEQLIFKRSDPSISHGINVLLYFVLNCFALLILQQIVPKDYKNRFFLIIAILILFCLHPIHANVVSSIKCRDNLLSALFTLISYFTLLKGIKNKFNWVYILLSIVLFIVAFYSKRDVLGYIIMMPITIFLYSHPKFTNVKISWKLPFGIAIITVLALLLINSITDEMAPIVETNGLTKSLVRYSENPLAENFNFSNKTNGLLSTSLLYLKMFIYPKGNYYYFGYNQINFPLNIGFNILSLFTILGLLLIAFYNINKNKLLSFGIFFMAVNLVYCINFFVVVAGIVAARYAFIASLGFCIIVGILINLIAHKTIKLLVLIAIICIYSILSFQRSSDWKSLESLIEADISCLNNSHEGQRIAANFYWEKADSSKDELAKPIIYRQAIQHIKRANEIYPDNYITHLHEGILWFKLNKIDSSIISFQKSIEVDTSQRKEGIELLGDAYYLKKDYPSAYKYYLQFFNENREKQYILNKISTTLYESGNKAASLHFNDSLIIVSPELYAPYENLAYYYLFERDTTMAINYLNKAIVRGLNDVQKEEMIGSFKATCVHCKIKEDKSI